MSGTSETKTAGGQLPAAPSNWKDCDSTDRIIFDHVWRRRMVGPLDPTAKVFA